MERGRTNDISKEQAMEFYCKLCEVVYGDQDKNCGGVMSVELITQHMKIDIEQVSQYCAAMIRHGITERQNGMIVV